MMAEDERAKVADLQLRLTLLRAELTRLAGACQAAVAADVAGEPDPLAVVRAEMAKPPDWDPCWGFRAGSPSPACLPGPLLSQVGDG
jgi:hypothetical protein